MTEDEEWRLLQAAVQRALDQGRLGRLAFVRLTTEQPGGREAMRDTLERLKGAVSQWAGGAPEASHTVGGEEQNHTSVMLRWPGGQSAILSVGLVQGGGEPWTDLVALGSRGALYYTTPQSARGPAP